MKKFIKICKKSQEDLKKWCSKELRRKGYDVIVGDGFVYAKGNIPVLVTAHMDTVHEVEPKKIVVQKGVISSPEGIGGDDRCGIYMIMEIIKRGYKPSILFCEDEEIGGVGSNKFVATGFINDLKEMKYLIELDRAHGNDAVYYDCGNEDFKDFILENTGYKEDFGSFSDISHLSPACDRASVNLSCGYYNAHTLKEYVVFSEMERTIDVVCGLLNIDYTEIEPFDYQEDYYDFRYGYNYSGYGYNGYKNNWYNYVPSTADYEDSFDGGVEIIFTDENGIESSSIEYGCNIEECIGKFLIKHPQIPFGNIIDYYEF